jgi:hypothetical protein
MQNLREVIAEIEKLPEPLLEEVLHFVRFIKSQTSQERFEAALLSETALRKDWLRPEEDKAWCDL